MSEPGAVCGPAQPERVWSRAHAANTLGADSPQTGSASVTGWGGVLQAQAGMAERWTGAAGDRTRSPGRAKAKPVDRGAPTNPSPAGTGLFQPLVALGFLPGQEGGPDLHCGG